MPALTAGLVSTRQVIQRWREAVESQVAVRGNLYYIAPGTTAIKVARRVVTPSDNADGLTPFTPLATINELITNRIVAAAGDVGVLMKEGQYLLSANISTTKNVFTLMGAPGLNRRSVFIDGIAGGPALLLRGDHCQLRNLEVGGASAADATVTVRGRYFQAINVHFTAKVVGTARPLAGLRIEVDLLDHPGFSNILGCLFSYLATGILVGAPNPSGGGDFNTLTEVRVEDCVFRRNTTRDIGQQALSGIDGWLIRGCAFPDLGNVDFITLNNALNGGEVINHITDCDFGHNAITATQIVLTNTTTAFKFTGNRDKAGFITGV